MVSTSTPPKFGVRFPSRKERTVKRVTKLETKEIQKRLEPPKPPRVRPPPKPRAPKKPPAPATLVKPPKPPRILTTHYRQRQLPVSAQNALGGEASSSKSTNSTIRTLQATDLEKLTRLNCSREFNLFHKYIKNELSKSYENQLAFLQTKLQHLKNEFVNKQAEHLNFEQIRDYYNDAVADNVRRRIGPEEYKTLAEKFKEDSKQAIDKWLKKKEFKQPKMLTEASQRRQARIRDRIKETLEEAKKLQQAAKDGETERTESSITIQPRTTTEVPTIVMEGDDDDNEDDIMVID